MRAGDMPTAVLAMGRAQRHAGDVKMEVSRQGGGKSGVTEGPQAHNGCVTMASPVLFRPQFAAL